MCVLVLFTLFVIALVAKKKKEEKRNRKEDMGREDKTGDRCDLDSLYVSWATHLHRTII